MPIIFADTLSPSWDLVADIQILLHFHFMQNAYLAGTLVAITAGLMGFFMVLLAVTVSEATLAVGALLVFALLLLPAAIAHRVTSRPSWALALSAGLAVALTWLGIGIGFYTGYPSSVCISLLAFVSYVVVVGSSQVGGWGGPLRRNLPRG